MAPVVQDEDNNNNNKKDSKKRPAPSSKNEEPPSEDGSTKAAEDKTTTTTTSSGRASKRERKSVDRMIPTNFVERPSSVPMIDGRGQTLKDIPVVFQHIDPLHAGSADIAEAFRFLFHRGKVTQASKKEAILNFNGYLERIPDDEDEEEEKDDKDDASTKKKKEKQDKMDEDAEAKMSKKAYKLKIAELKKLCDFFQVDRSAKDGESVTKDVLVDRLLDFLSEPDESHCIKLKGGGSSSNKSSNGKKGGSGKKAKATSKKSSSSKSKKTGKKEEDDKEDSEEEEEEEAAEASADDDEEEEAADDKKSKGKKLPSDKALRKWVKAYVTCFNLDKATTKHAMATASDKFGVDLSEKKRIIKKMLTEEM